MNNIIEDSTFSLDHLNEMEPGDVTFSDGGGLHCHLVDEAYRPRPRPIPIGLHHETQPVSTVWPRPTDVISTSSSHIPNDCLDEAACHFEDDVIVTSTERMSGLTENSVQEKDNPDFVDLAFDEAEVARMNMSLNARMASFPSEDEDHAGAYSFEDEDEVDDLDDWWDCHSDLPREPEETRPLYQGSPITLAESMLAILLFVTRHNLTGTALSDLLTLVSLHCLTPNLCKTSLHLFYSFFGNLKSPVKYHKYCSFCMFLLEKEQPKCPICKREISNEGKTSYFIEIPIDDQIQNLVQKPGFFKDDLHHRFDRQKRNDKNIEDIYDGIQYKRHTKKGGFLESKHNISFMWYTDGCPLFKSSKVSLWPLYFAINELPYEKRLLKENLIYAGLWLGEKPSMGSFLKPFHHSLQQLKNEGIFVTVPGEDQPIKMRAMVLCGTCDLPARCLVLNMIQFNGAYGCCHCFQKGQSAATGRGSTWTYPFQELNATGPKRTHSTMMNDAKEAYVGKTSVRGIKGPTFLSFTGCDLVNGTAIDYMHTVLLGVVRKLMHLWFDSSHHRELFSLSKHINEVDVRLMEIKPPTFISRVPRSIKDHLSYWKASECRSWLFFYAIPVLHGILPEIYLNHFALLVEAIYVLNSESISSEQLSYCDRLLYHFCCTFSTLYGERYMTAVVHQLVHLTDTVRHLGPLWVYSCFAFEDANGMLLKMVKGTQKPEIQIVSNLQIMLKLPQLHCSLLDCSKIKPFVKAVTRKKREYTSNFDDNVRTIGRLKEHILCDNELLSLVEYLGTVPHKCFKFLRLQIAGKVFHSKSYTLTSKRNSYTVHYRNQGLDLFGHVEYFLKCVSTCTCEHHQCTCKGLCFAVVSNLKMQPTRLINDTVSGNKLGHITEVTTSEVTHIIPAEHLLAVCVFMKFSSMENKMYISHVPNLFESD